MQLLRPFAIAGLALTIALPAHAVEIHGMKDFAPLYGKYAPGGDCQKLPRFEVAAAGMRFELPGGKSEQVTTMEFAASYGGNFYQGTSQWFFPFGRDGNYPVLMTFNAEEKAGVVSIDAHDEGYPGGPALSPRSKALVSGSPYRRCK